MIQKKGEEFHPIIIDFGKSKEILKVEGYQRRTEADYIAPEVKAGQRESRASDIYSFGKMLHAAVSGRSLSSLFSQIISDTTASDASISPLARFSSNSKVLMLNSCRIE